MLLGADPWLQACRSGRSAAWLARLVRDQEVDGSNPFAPTNLLGSATYKTGKRIERLVQGQEVDGSSPFAPTIISPLNSILYAALSTATSGRDLGTTGTAEGFFVENVKPSPTLSATSFLYSTSSRSFEYPSVTVSSA